MVNDTTDSDGDKHQTTLLSFEKVEVSNSTTGQTSEGVSVKVASEREDNTREFNQYRSLPKTPGLHEKIMAMAQELNIDTRVIDLPALLTLRTDENGKGYVTDMNGVVRYYPDSNVLETTGDYEGREKTADGTQRKNDLLQMYETA